MAMNSSHLSTVDLMIEAWHFVLMISTPSCSGYILAESQLKAVWGGLETTASNLPNSQGEGGGGLLLEG